MPVFPSHTDTGSHKAPGVSFTELQTWEKELEREEKEEETDISGLYRQSSVG